MRFAVILAVLALIGVAGVWLFAGRQLVLLLDCIATGPAEALPVAEWPKLPRPSSTLPFSDMARCLT